MIVCDSDLLIGDCIRCCDWKHSIGFLHLLNGLQLTATNFLLKVAIQAACQVHQQGVSLKEDSVTRSGHYGGNLSSSFNSSQLQECWGCRQSLTQELSRLCFTLSLDNGGSFVLECLLDKILGSFGLLLCDLLLFDGLGELGAEVQVSNGYIIKDDIEVLKSISETVTDLL